MEVTKQLTETLETHLSWQDVSGFLSSFFWEILPWEFITVKSQTWGIGFFSANHETSKSNLGKVSQTSRCSSFWLWHPKVLIPTTLVCIRNPFGSQKGGLIRSWGSSSVFSYFLHDKQQFGANYTPEKGPNNQTKREGT